MRHLSHAIGFDDAPFEPAHLGDVLVVGAVYSGARLDGVLTAAVRRDGANAPRVLGEVTNRSRFREHLLRSERARSCRPPTCRRSGSTRKRRCAA